MTAPAVRNPSPTMAGNAAYSTANALKQAAPIDLGRPVVGTAWELGGLTIKIGIGFNPVANEIVYVDLVLGGQVIDVFAFDGKDSIQTQFHPYQPAFTIYDTGSLQAIVRDPIGAGAAGPFQWNGNVAYL